MMACTLHGRRVNLDQPIELAIPLDFNGRQPTYFGAPVASAVPYQSGTFRGDTRLGSSCNVDVLTVIPHCNGTHTECVGHISKKRLSISDIPTVHLAPATLISILEPGGAILRSSIRSALDRLDPQWLTGLIIRTSRDSANLAARNYDEEPATSIDPDAMELLVDLGVKHLVVDLPSVDEGSSQELPSHRAFWSFDDDEPSTSRGDCTITELVAIPEQTPDGIYALSISWPRLQSDAAPSRPILFPVS